MTFGEKVRAAREARNMTQEQLADAIGMSKRMVSYWENHGKLPKSRETYPIIADALGIDVSVLLDDDAEFVIKAAETYGNRGAQQALQLVEQITAPRLRPPARPPHPPAPAAAAQSAPSSPR